MKKFALLASLMLMGASASMAQWSNKQDEYLRVFPEKSLSLIPQHFSLTIFISS